MNWQKIAENRQTLWLAEKAKRERLQKELQKAIDWLERAPFDYSNGNTDSTGTIDEGNVYGWQAHHQLVEELKAAIREE